MHRKIYTVLGLVVILLLTGCTMGVTRYGDLRGYVGIRKTPEIWSQGEQSGQINPEDVVISSAAYDGYDEPLVGAKVHISGEGDWTTERDGMFEARKLRIGFKTVTISHPKLRDDLVIPYVEVREGRQNMSPVIGGVGYYLVIGIEDYQYLPDAMGAEYDATGVAKVFEKHSKLQGYGKVLLGANAERAMIKQEIQNFVLEATPEDYLVIYFAGHMGPDYLSPYDDDGRFYSTAITDSDLEGWLREFPGYVTVILDGSDSATFADGREPLIRPQALQKPKYTVITSAGEGQEAHVVEGGHGLFTHYLIAGLSTPEERLESDKNGDRTITAQEIFDYIKAGIQKHVGGAQVPELHVGSSENTVILRY